MILRVPCQIKLSKQILLCITHRRNFWFKGTLISLWLLESDIHKDKLTDLFKKDMNILKMNELNHFLFCLWFYKDHISGRIVFAHMKCLYSLMHTIFIKNYSQENFVEVDCFKSQDCSWYVCLSLGFRYLGK